MLKATLLTVLALPLLTGCAAIGLTATEGLAVTGAAASAAVVATAEEESSVKVYGNYGNEHGFWLDRELYFVWVVSDSPDISERHARALAGNSCAARGRSLRVIENNAWQERALFIPVKLNRFSTEIRFRCDYQPAELF